MTPDPHEQTSWYCLRSRPKHEHIAAAHLRQMAGVEVFCPRLRFKRPTVRGARWFEEAMFPGYLFARFDFIERHKEVGYANGISGILRFGERYAAVSEGIVAMLRDHTNETQVAVIEPDIREGDSVTIVQGAMTGIVGVVTHFLSGRERVRVLLDFLGREMHAEVEKTAVLPAKRHPLAA